MNVIVANERQNDLANLDVDIIKNMTGSFQVQEIVEMFKNFFYGKMILDVTALKQYSDLRTYEELIQGLDPDKIVFLLPEGSSLCTPNFLSKLISIGIYNFTTNLKGVKILLKKTNTLKDVEHIQKMASGNSDSSEEESTVSVTTKVTDGVTVIGFRNVTEHAGSTTLIYILKKELSNAFGKENVIAIEVGKSDFGFFGDKNMISVRDVELRDTIEKYSNVNVILVDLNQCKEDSYCSDILYLLEPSTLRLNKLIRKNREIFQELKNRKLVLNKSLLLNNDVIDFEKEAGMRVFYNLPPLDERKRNAIVNDFLMKLGIFQDSSQDDNSGRIFGLFRR